MTTNGSPELNLRSMPDLMRHFHSVLNTAWPKPGVVQMSGASVFIGTNLFMALENGITLMKAALNNSENAIIRVEAESFWRAFEGLFMRLKVQNRHEKSERIDKALNLLYLSSGVFYHRIVELSCSVPTCDDRKRGVEDLDELLNLCQWPFPGRTTKVVFDSLVSEMNKSLAD